MDSGDIELVAKFRDGDFEEEAFALEGSDGFVAAPDLSLGLLLLGLPLAKESHRIRPRPKETIHELLLRQGNEGSIRRPR